MSWQHQAFVNPNYTAEQCAGAFDHKFEEELRRAWESPHFYQYVFNLIIAVLLAGIITGAHATKLSVASVFLFVYLTVLFYRVLTKLTTTSLVETMQSFGFSNLLALLLVYPVARGITYPVLASVVVLTTLLYIMFNTLTGSNLPGSLPYATYPVPPHLGLDGISVPNRAAGLPVNPDLV